MRLTESKETVLRWAVGSPNGLSGTAWRFWGNKKGDFYLSGRSLGHIMKTSFHRDGRCQTGLTQMHFGSVPVSDNLKDS